MSEVILQVITSLFGELQRTTCCLTSPHPSIAHFHITQLLKQQAQACHLYLHGAWHLHTGKAIRLELRSLIQRGLDRLSLMAPAIRFHCGMTKMPSVFLHADISSVALAEEQR